MDNSTVKRIEAAMKLMMKQAHPEKEKLTSQSAKEKTNTNSKTKNSQ